MTNGKERKDLTQLELTPFVRNYINNTLKSNVSEDLNIHSIKTLQEIARDHKIQNRSKMSKGELINIISLYRKKDPTEREWKKILGNGWILLEDTKTYINHQSSMIIGAIENKDTVINVRNIHNDFILKLKEKRIDYLATLLERKDNHIVLRLNDTFYDFNLIGESYRIIGDDIFILQNSQGFILLKNSIRFSIIAPMFF